MGGVSSLDAASVIPGGEQLVGGVVLTVAGAPCSGPVLIPGVFLRGLAIAEYDLVTVLMRRPGILAAAFNEAMIQREEDERLDG